MVFAKCSQQSCYSCGEKGLLTTRSQHTCVHGCASQTLHACKGALEQATWLVSGASLVTGWTHADNAYGLQCSGITYIGFMLLPVKQRSEAWAAERHFRLVNKFSVGLELCSIKHFSCSGAQMGLGPTSNNIWQHCLPKVSLY